MRCSGEGPIYGARRHPRYRAAWRRRVRCWGEAETFLGNVSVSPSNGGGVRLRVFVLSMRMDEVSWKQ